ncbi:hypothetical protein OG203_34740 [Nocardia sp. NBC_01499]|uniref:hypothetical protein n=1 Tax=Nocardia sp. NBC_01499 TaxID=2903597 RepID=UPI003863E5B9
MTVSTSSATINMTFTGRISLLDIVIAYGTDAVVARITTLRMSGCRHAARAIERELNELDLLLSESESLTGG